MAVKFYLNTKGKWGEEVSVILSVNRNYKMVKVALPVTVKRSNWDKKAQAVKGPGAVETNEELRRFKMEAERLALRYPDDADLRDGLREMLGRGKSEAAPAILDEYARFKKEKEHRVRSNTLKIYTTIDHKLRAWLKPSADVTTIGPGWLDDFATYLIGTGLGNSTVNKITARTKSFLRWLEARELIRKVPNTKSLPTARNKAVYLTANELQALATLDLSGKPAGWKSARDLFIAGAVTGQRYGDLQAMRWSDLSGGAWHLSPEKTGEPILVPLTAPVLRIIEARKALGKKSPMPQLSNQKANKFLKLIAEEAKIKAPVSVTTLKGGERKRETRKKHEVLTTHAARRTYITLSLQNGVSMSELLNYTHADLRSLRAYVGEDEMKRAENMHQIFGRVGNG